MKFPGGLRLIRYSSMLWPGDAVDGQKFPQAAPAADPWIRGSIFFILKTYLLF